MSGIGQNFSRKLKALWAPICLVVLTACSPSENTSKSGVDLAYTFKAMVDEGLHKRVEVTLRLIGDRDGKTEIILGSEEGDETRPWRRFRHLKVEGGRADREPEQDDYSYTIFNEPGAPLTLTYTLSSRDAPNPRTDLDFFYLPVVRKSNIVIKGFGGLAYPYPDERETSTVSVVWENLPEGWTSVETIPERPLYIQELREQVIIATQSEFLFRSPDKPGLSVFKSGKHPYTTDEFGDRTVKLLTAMETLWEEEVPEYLVAMSGVPARSSYASYSGIGLYNAFSSTVSDDLGLWFLTRFFAHEISHQWMPDRLGSRPLCSTEYCAPKISWFAEGFTNYVLGEVMIESGLWTQSDLIDYSNELIRDYYISPAQNASASEIDDWFWIDGDYRDQPYIRGYIIARNWDAEMKTRGKPAVMSVLREMRDLADAAPDNDPPVLSHRYIADMFTPDLGRNPESDIEDFYVAGKTIDIRDDWFPGCAKLKKIRVSEYDAGFDIEEAWNDGEIGKVYKGSSAKAAGLEEGMELINVQTKGYLNPEMAVTLTVKDGKTEKDITYLPASKQKTRIPQFVKIGDCAAE